ncbi:GlxA family transcriptional regulator [Herbaspirillum rubrisubalbicans]|nr:helix-turn-helix domain-containing protein [Herbaspirillum rubrisubalbicans]
MTTRKIVFIAFDGADPLDLIGPIGVFSRAEEIAPGSYDIRIASVDGAILCTRSPLSLAGIVTLSSIEGSLDTVLVAGGHEQAIRQAVTDVALLEWLNVRGRHARRIGSICTGAFLLGAAGLLDGRHVTTHWAAVDLLQQHFPEAKVDPDAIYRMDGPLCTSAGVTTGIDLALALVREDLGQEVAGAIARDLVLFLHRPGRQQQISSTLAAQQSAGDLFSELLVWMLDHPQEDMRVSVLAERAAMSPRNFARRFLREVGKSPGQYVIEIRIQHACRHLEKTNWTIERIAERSGLKNADNMHRIFRQHLSMTPADYRSRLAQE